MNENSEKTQNLLVDRLKNGDRSAAAELVDAYYKQIYLYMRRLGHSRQVSEDLTQESFLQAWQHIGQIKNGSAISGWLYSIASNASKLYWRKNKNSSVSIENIQMPGFSDAASDLAGKSEQLMKLRKSLLKLPFKLRQVIVLHYMQQLSIVDAAKAADIKDGTFKSRLNRALKVLKKEVADKTGGQQ